jgi:hypothetical protein
MNNKTLVILFVLVTISSLLIGCATPLVRHPLPEERSESAQIP